MSDLRDPKALVDLLVDSHREGATGRIELILSALMYERDARQGFKPAPPNANTKTLDAMMARRITPVASPIAIPGRTDLPFVSVPVSSELAGGKEMTQGQAKAWAMINRWLASDEPYCVIKGYAGTGKSFLMDKVRQIKGHNFYFSAPTNKATKVLSDFVGETCKTTYSLLGLRMVAEDGEKVLKQTGRTPELGARPVLVIDEAGMIPEFLAEILRNLCEELGWRAIFVGDPAQLNPVGESRSLVWGMAKPEFKALLTEVKRFDNQLLGLSVAIRNCLKGKVYKSPIVDDNDGREGIFVVSKDQMLDSIRGRGLEDWRTTKVACWRNKTVNVYNRIIREALGFKIKDGFEPDDMILLAEPLVDSMGQILAFTDEEFQIKEVHERVFEYPEGKLEATAYSLHNSHLTLFKAEDPGELSSMLNKRASKAQREKDSRKRKELWADFWSLKNKFTDIRHGYAMTTHRLQGSTLDEVYVDQADILANPNKRESFRSLYVAATRPRFKLTTY